MSKAATSKNNARKMLTLNLDKQLYDYINEKPAAEPITEWQGNQQVVVGEKILTARLVCQRVLFNLLRDEENLTGDQKMEIGNLGVLISRGGDIELTVEEVKELRARCRKGLWPQFLVQVDPIFENILK